MSKFYITTPIYYVNDQPHIGHAYTSLAADVLSAYHRMLGDRVYFLTGSDEHGQKVEQAAQAKGLSPKEHSDIMVENFKALWEKLELTHNDFIRTTDPDHKAVVQKMLQRLYDKGEIEKRTYAGWYCTPCERFWTEKDLNEGNCPDCGRPVEEIEEENYFFLMSKYAQKLESHINENPDFIPADLNNSSSVRQSLTFFNCAANSLSGTFSLPRSRKSKNRVPCSMVN